MVLTINGVTKKPVFGTLRIQNILTRKRDTCSFTFVTHPNESYAPNLGQEVIITDGATRIFGGIITNITSKPTSFAVIMHEVECQDYMRLLDQRLVPDIYENMTVDEIIADLKDQYFPAGFTTNNVDAPAEIKYIAFNYKPLAKCIEQLADLINYDYYVDYFKDLYFKEHMVEDAPFNIADDDGSYDYSSLTIRKDNSQVRNVIIVRGGDYLAPQTTVEIEIEPALIAYDTKYRWSDISVSVTGDQKTVGIENIHEFSGYDILYNFQERRIVFQDGRQPALGTIKIGGKPNLPLILKYRSQPHIDAMKSAEGGSGVYEYLVKDNSINTKEGGKQRAQAEIEAYAMTLSEGEFTTETAGLKAGQRIRVVSASRDVDQYFVINRVTTTQRTKDSMQYDVSLVTTRTFDFIDLMHRLLLKETTEIVVDEGEIVNLIENVYDSFRLTDTVVATTTVGTYKWQPTSTPIALYWDFGVWG